VSLEAEKCYGCGRMARTKMTKDHDRCGKGADLHPQEAIGLSSVGSWGTRKLKSAL
jgi:hypothetical protein